MAKTSTCQLTFILVAILFWAGTNGGNFSLSCFEGHNSHVSVRYHGNATDLYSSVKMRSLCHGYDTADGTWMITNLTRPDCESQLVKGAWYGQVVAQVGNSPSPDDPKFFYSCKMDYKGPFTSHTIHAGPILTSDVALKVTDLDEREVTVIHLGALLQFNVFLNPRPHEKSLSIIACKAANSFPFPSISRDIIANGCGTNGVIPDDKGFYTKVGDGYIIGVSAPFRAFKLGSYSSLQFLCSFIVCTNDTHCAGDSCGIFGSRSKRHLEPEESEELFTATTQAIRVVNGPSELPIAQYLSAETKKLDDPEMTPEDEGSDTIDWALLISATLITFLAMVVVVLFCLITALRQMIRNRRKGYLTRSSSPVTMSDVPSFNNEGNPPMAMSQQPVQHAQPIQFMQQPGFAFPQTQPDTTSQQYALAFLQQLLQSSLSLQMMPTVPSQHPGLPSQQNTVPPSQQPAVSSEQQSMPLQQLGLPSQQPGLPSQQLGLPSQQPRLPSQQPGLPSQQQGLPPQQPGLPSQQQGLPSQQAGLPSQHLGRPSQQGEVSPHQQALASYPQPAAPTTPPTGFAVQSVPPFQQPVLPSQTPYSPSQKSSLSSQQPIYSQTLPSADHTSQSSQQLGQHSQHPALHVQQVQPTGNAPSPSLVPNGLMTDDPTQQTVQQASLIVQPLGQSPTQPLNHTSSPVAVDNPHSMSGPSSQETVPTGRNKSSLTGDDLNDMDGHGSLIRRLRSFLHSRASDNTKMSQDPDLLISSNAHNMMTEENSFRGRDAQSYESSPEVASAPREGEANDSFDRHSQSVEENQEDSFKPMKSSSPLDSEIFFRRATRAVLAPGHRSFGSPTNKSDDGMDPHNVAAFSGLLDTDGWDFEHADTTTFWNKQAEANQSPETEAIYENNWQLMRRQESKKRFYVANEEDYAPHISPNKASGQVQPGQKSPSETMP